MTIRVHRGDLPDLSHYRGGAVAIDTETMGLNPHRDRLCLVQLCDRKGTAAIVQITRGCLDRPLAERAPRLKKLMESPKVEKVFHFARFDVAALKHWLGIEVKPIYCTRTVSKLIRTYTDRHGLKDVTKELLGVDISKAQQSSDWGAAPSGSGKVVWFTFDLEAGSA